MNQFKRSKLIEAFLKHNEVDNISTKDNEPEAHFSWDGCDVCENGLGTDVYEIHGYSSKHKKVFDLGEACHECLCVEANGIEDGSDRGEL